MNHLLTVADAVATYARLTPRKIGVRDSKRALSFGHWNTRSNKLANALLSLGLEHGDKVAVLAYNCIEWMELYVAFAKVGLVAVPINFRLTPPEIAYIAQHCEARAFIAHDELVESIQTIRKELSIKPDNFIQISGLPAFGWQSYEQLIANASDTAPPVEVKPSDTSALMYTSGTTGRPKGVVRSHEGSSLIALATALAMKFTSEDIGLMVMPMCHANSLYFSHTFTQLGATCVIDDRKSFDPETLLATLSNDKITFTSLVPTHYIMMLALPEDIKAKYDVSSVAKLMISSAPARRDTKLAILDFFQNAGLHELYGSTEAGWVTLLRPDEQISHLGSVGREWAGSGAIKIFDPNGIEVADGEVGELYSRTPYVFDGYWKNPEKTSEAMRNGWCSVGDMARRDPHGYIYLVDRKSNMIISGGENIYPSEVEGALGLHPQIKDVAVVGMPHEKWGEAVHAVVVKHEGATLSETELINWCRGRIAGYKRPQSIQFISDTQMPRTATGKILHRVLRDQLCKELVASHV
jgi:fatty-acyl-CoA synthase